MFEDGYLGAPEGVESLRSLNEQLTAQVVAQVSSTQELVTMNKFEHEANEYLFKKCLQERISDIESWRWVLEDLSKRLGDAIDALRYEHHAIRVVVGRVQEEIGRRSQEASRPGAMTPQSDGVEEAIFEEYNFLRDQKKQFDKMILEMNEETLALEKVKKRIEADALGKQEAIKVEESCASIDLQSANPCCGKKVKKSLTPMNRWENRCYSLKRKGLSALTHALIIRHQVRAARTQLSVSAQSYANKVDSALRRRMHANQSKLHELQWQREEAIRDYQALAEELTVSEQNTLETMEKQLLVEARLSDRKLRPARELIRDVVDRKLRDELKRLKQCLKFLRQNIERITSLQKDLTASISQINCMEEDITQVVRLDEDRIRGRCDDESEQIVSTTNYDSMRSPSSSSHSNDSRTSRAQEGALATIREDEEEADDYDGVDDYPLDY